MPSEQILAQQLLGKLSGPLIVYDGVCVLCHSAIHFIHRHESAGRLKITPLQSELGIWLQHHFNIDLLADNTIMVIHNHDLLIRSDALIAIAAWLDRPWRWLGWYRFLPRWLRDGLYEQLARRRYRIFGRYDSCRIPDTKLRGRLLSNISALG